EIGERVARREASRIAIMAELSRTVAEAGLGFQSVLDTIALSTAEHTGDACVIMLLNEDDEPPRIDALHHDNPRVRAALAGVFDRGRLAHLRRVAGQVVATGEAAISPALADAISGAIALSSATRTGDDAEPATGADIGAR